VVCFFVFRVKMFLLWGRVVRKFFWLRGGGGAIAFAFKVRRQVFPQSFGEFLPDNAMLPTKGQYLTCEVVMSSMNMFIIV